MSTPETRPANADYTVVDHQPLFLRTGDEVRAGGEDRAWPGWVWVTAPAAGNRGTYVPKDSVEIAADGVTGRMTRDFAATDLSVRKGEIVTCLREAGGWFWCRNAAGEEGWLPDYILS